MSQALRSQIEKIVSLTDDEFETVLSYFSVRNFLKHQFIVQEGNPVRQNFFIVKGLVKSFQLSEEGKENIVQFAMDGYWVTDTEAFYQQKTAQLNINCLENCQTLSITHQNLEKLCAESDKMEYYFRKKAFNDIAQLQRRILCLIKGTAADRYHDLADNYPELIQRVPKAMIASYLGVSRETLSRMTLS